MARRRSDQERIAYLESTVDALRRTVTTSVRRQIGRERLAAGRQLEERLRTGGLAGQREWSTRRGTPATASRLDTPLLSRLREDIDSVPGSPNAAAGLVDPILSGLLNGSFQESPPQGHGSTLGLTNQLPYWAFNLTEVPPGRVTVAPETSPDVLAGGAVATWVDLPTELSVPGGAVKFVTSASGVVTSYITQEIGNPPAFSNWVRPLVFANVYVPSGSGGTDVDVYLLARLGVGSFVSANERKSAAAIAALSGDVYTLVIDPAMRSSVGVTALSPTYGTDYEWPLHVEIGVDRAGAGGTAATVYVLGAGVLWTTTDRTLFLRALDPSLTGEPELGLASGVPSDRRALFMGTDDVLYMVGTSGIPVPVSSGSSSGGATRAYGFFMGSGG